MWEQEMGMEMNEYQGENFELAGEYQGELAGEFPGELAGEFATEFSGEFQGESPLNEMQEMELAAELLSVTNEAELNQFLGGLIKKAAGFIKSPVGKALGGILKGVAKKALPIVGGAIGSFVAPGVGTAIGSSLGSAAGKLFGLELEGLSNEDREFEVARRVVRLGAVAARHAATAPRHIPPHHVARRAMTVAARRHAPGLLTRPASMPQGTPTKPTSSWPAGGYRSVAPAAYPTTYRITPPPQNQDPYGDSQPATYQDPYGGMSPGENPEAVQSGRWIRRGRHIILLGA